MSFVNSLNVKLIEENKFYEDILELEEEFSKNKNLEFEILENEIIVFNKNFIENEYIGFKDYIEVGKIIKNFLIEKNLASLENYKNLFKIKKINFSEDKVNLDEYITKVDENDEKVKEALNFLKKLENKKTKIIE